MKLWTKTNNTPSSEWSKKTETFTVGNDRELDAILAPFDVLGNIAHAKMLASAGLLLNEEADMLVKELRDIYERIQNSKFKIQNNTEDIHSEIEFLLTQKLGDTGKKIHSARSRNDQVLVDIKLFLRSELEKTVHGIQSLFELLILQSEKYKTHLLPGYTHLQLAMPSSFGLWFGAYAESLVDDVVTLKAAYNVVNKNPLGSAAGYGSSFPINRAMTTKLLGFADLHYNSVYAQMSRGKTERITASALANVADTLSKLSMDCCLFLNQNFSFISFQDELTTGSSIMPHKKNPDVFELIRSHCNRIKALPNEIMMMTTNLPSGYHRDLQLLKEHLFPAFETLRNCMDMAILMLSNIEVKENILADEKYKYLFTVEEVNRLVMQGIPFRDAYKMVGEKVENGTFTPSSFREASSHTPPSPGEAGRGPHEGSISNLCNEQIADNMKNVIEGFQFEKYHEAIDQLLNDT